MKGKIQLMVIFVVLSFVTIPLFSQADTQLSPGDFVESVVSLNVRDSPGGNRVVVAEKGTIGRIISGPSKSKLVWWEIDWGNNLKGWSAQGNNKTEFIRKHESSDFEKNDHVEVIVKGLKVRQRPGLDNNVLGVKAEKEQGKLVSGPMYIDGYEWWEIEWNSIKAWSAVKSKSGSFL